MLLKAKSRIGSIKWREQGLSALLLLSGAVLAAFNFHVFIVSSDIAPGGVSGLTIILTSFTSWPNGVVLLLMQVPMLLLGFHHLGGYRFLIRTVIVVIIYSLLIDVLAWSWPNAMVTPDPLLNALYGGIVGGIASGLVFRGRGTMGGTGVLGRVIQLRTGMPVSQIYLFTDGSIIALLGFRFGWENSLYALIMLFVWGLATDYVLEGPSVIRTAFIITDQPKVVADALVNRTGLGVTSWQGQGMFTGKTHTILFCTVRRPDVNGLKSVVLEADPGAFVVIGQGHEAEGGVLRQLQKKGNP